MAIIGDVRSVGRIGRLGLTCIYYWCDSQVAQLGKESTCLCRRNRRYEFSPWVGKIPWRGKWQPTPVFLPGKSRGQRSLVGYSSWGCKESDTTEQLNWTEDITPTLRGGKNTQKNYTKKIVTTQITTVVGSLTQARYPGVRSQVYLRKHHYEQNQWRWWSSSWAILNPER